MTVRDGHDHMRNYTLLRSNSYIAYQPNTQGKRVEYNTFVMLSTTNADSLGRFMHATSGTVNPPLTYVWGMGQVATIVCFEVQR